MNYYRNREPHKKPNSVGSLPRISSQLNMISKEENKESTGMENELISRMDSVPSPLLANSKYKKASFMFDSFNKSNSHIKEFKGEIDLAALQR